jgi:hypothetical protein
VAAKGTSFALRALSPARWLEKGWREVCQLSLL